MVLFVSSLSSKLSIVSAACLFFGKSHCSFVQQLVLECPQEVAVARHWGARVYTLMEFTIQKIMNLEFPEVSPVQPTPHCSKTAAVMVHCADDVGQALSLGTGLANCFQPFVRFYSFPPSFFSSSYLRRVPSDVFTYLCHFFSIRLSLDDRHLATFLESRSTGISPGPSLGLLSAGPGDRPGEQLEVTSLFWVLSEWSWEVIGKHC